jgi:hypothetical protein
MLINFFYLNRTLDDRQPVADGQAQVVLPMLHPKKMHEQPHRNLHFLRYLMDSWFGAVLGGGVYGAWAVWANWAQGASTAWGIGAAHWLTSALLTFFGTLAMRQFYGKAQGWAGSLRAFAGGLCLTYASLLAVHGLLGTEQLLLTLAPGIVPNILFCTSYALLLKRTTTVATL